ncbi:HTH-type transcriptional regulator hmrR AltName: Full=Copper efflux regulator [Fibrisoma limi BUZ 3]|uniref:HmrR protein n=1 Tax=Fibrisoma limi BUZ 3 TaxID=1185876 RepID=I2GD82_9BACT|nr:MerR family transcriptional regulator [Fibrisoma limi]CCH51856.1 HTH-type transcriptional regulator hmrR AltName: Full=Copper efflux regulator [Fibrisoma limi BUZ 3]
MHIGELAERTGFTHDTIRFYGKLGLLPVKRTGSGFKQYTDWHVIRLLQIKYAKAMGFSLQQIRETIDSWETGDLSVADKLRVLHDQLSHLDQAIAEIEQVKAYVRHKITVVEAGADDISRFLTDGQPALVPAGGLPEKA